MYLHRRKRFQWNRIVFLLTGVLVCFAYQLSFSWRSAPWTRHDDGDNVDSFLDVETRELSNKSTADDTTDPPETTTDHTPLTTDRTTLRNCIVVDPEPAKTTTIPTTTTPVPNTTALTNATSTPLEIPYHTKGEYPQDIFTVEERRKGWVVLHIFGMIYMFVSLAIVCDEFFVPALGVITDKLAISDDVAGATFMAAGGSAPELFTSLIGVFISHSNVGIGTIVGSAVFNILFVIGMCALFSREMLHLTWWPLFRDVSFYIVGLIMLIVFFLDNVIVWWESMLLLCAYVLYVFFMKYNVQVEHFFKAQLNKHKSIVRVIALEEPDNTNGSAGGEEPPPPEDKNRLKLKPSLQRGGSSASLHNSTMRNTIFQLMIHTLDPLAEGEDKEDAPNNVNVQVTPPTEPSTSQPVKEEEKKDLPEGNETQEVGGSGGSDDSEDSDEDSDDEDSDEKEEEEDEEENDKPLSLEWPDTRRKQATYLFLLPIVFPLWLTVPDVRSAASKKFFAMTFLGSIIWIAVFSYLMVWWAHQVGETVGISEEIMGLTILAAGTSIPDLITSVIVARKGLGDMAVSSSVGSNIFDITVGLPGPWLMYSLINGFTPVAVSSNGLFCAIVLLFLMLLFVIFSIAVCKWKMNKFLGCIMFALYFFFLVVSVMLEDRIIMCPVSI
ncbi:sodium/potassium/calcium exchanger 1-like isoform X5 [Acipenser ruthenus]|uniref:sodium/potassium/calcium exchanger 1-like isoform X5 n=1 Tax=Acipenser ruthenus TaxID=7906 RepID=UPI0027413968|nr:sodium/potassium/calcium exchanger 1-like isoform X5 [Acipenser ruthenus]